MTKLEVTAECLTNLPLRGKFAEIPRPVALCATMLTIATAALGFQASMPALAPQRSGSVQMGAYGVGDKLPASALNLAGVKGKKAAIFFYGADDAPSCSKEIQGFDSALPLFKELGVSVVGVRNGAGVKLSDDPDRLKLVVDEDDAVRNELAIEKDFFLLGGRESYVVDASGDPDVTVVVAAAAVAYVRVWSEVEHVAATRVSDVLCAHR